MTGATAAETFRLRCRHQDRRHAPERKGELDLREQPLQSEGLPHQELPAVGDHDGRCEAHAERAAAVRGVAGRRRLADGRAAEQDGSRQVAQLCARRHCGGVPG